MVAKQNVEDSFNAPISIQEMASRTIGPSIVPCKKISVPIQHHSKVIQVSGFVSENGRMYEEGPVMKYSRFGCVKRSCLLEKVEGQKEYARNTKKAFAIKMYEKKKIENNVNGENPLNEIRILRQIGKTNPYLVHIVDCYADEDNIYLILPFFSGGDLLDLMNFRCGEKACASMALNPYEASEMFHHLVQAVQYLHSVGIVHRDLSIENILFDESTRRFVLTDFGMSQVCAKDVVSGKYQALVKDILICGKKNYIAPELWHATTSASAASSIDLFNCDLWSLGVILYMALTGSVPFHQASTIDARFHLLLENRFYDMLEANEVTVDRVYDYLNEGSAAHERMKEDYREGFVQGLNLIEQLLIPDPSKRATLADILQHPFLTFYQQTEENGLEEMKNVQLGGHTMMEYNMVMDDKNNAAYVTKNYSSRYTSKGNGKEEEGEATTDVENVITAEDMEENRKMVEEEVEEEEYEYEGHQEEYEAEQEAEYEEEEDGHGDDLYVYD